MQDTNEEIKKIKDVVEEVLNEDDRSRNDDKWLIFQTLRKMGFKIFIDFKEMRRMPSFETITRCRRFFQNTEGKFIPNKRVDELRDAKQEIYKTAWKHL